MIVAGLDIRILLLEAADLLLELMGLLACLLVMRVDVGILLLEGADLLLELVALLARLLVVGLDIGVLLLEDADLLLEINGLPALILMEGLDGDVLLLEDSDLLLEIMRLLALFIMERLDGYILLVKRADLLLQHLGLLALLLVKGFELINVLIEIGDVLIELGNVLLQPMCLLAALILAGLDGHVLLAKGTELLLERSGLVAFKVVANLQVANLLLEHGGLLRFLVMSNTELAKLLLKDPHVLGGSVGVGGDTAVSALSSGLEVIDLGSQSGDLLVKFGGFGVKHGVMVEQCADLVADLSHGDKYLLLVICGGGGEDAVVILMAATVFEVRVEGRTRLGEADASRLEELEVERAVHEGVEMTEIGQRDGRCGLSRVFA